MEPNLDSFAARLERRDRLWWGLPRLGDPASWWRGLHREREWRTFRGRSEPETAWRCCEHWPRSLVNKWNGREYASRHGLQVPALYWRRSPRGPLPFEQLPPHFVVRGLRGHGRNHVLVVAAGRELLRGEEVSPETLRRRVRRFRDGWWPLPILAEELVRSPDGSYRLPVEYKCHTFGAAVAAVQVVHRPHGGGGVTTAFYTPAWEPFGDRGTLRLAPAPVEPPPAFLAEMVDQAARVGAAVGTYLRIDFFASDRGCVFNEFSSVPGGGRGFTPFVDERFGAAWRANVPGAV